MKKGLFFVGALVALSLSSCKKDYQCVCTYDLGSGSETFTYELGKIKKKDAKDACDAAGAAWILIQGTCEAKAK